MKTITQTDKNKDSGIYRQKHKQTVTYTVKDINRE